MMNDINFLRIKQYSKDKIVYSDYNVLKCSFLNVVLVMLSLKMCKQLSNIIVSIFYKLIILLLVIYRVRSL